MKIFRIRHFFFAVCCITFLIFTYSLPATFGAEISVQDTSAADSSAVEVRPVSGFKVFVPAADARQLIENMKPENSRLVEIDYSEFLGLSGRNNKLLAERRKAEIIRERLNNRPKNPPADYAVTGASYKFVKNGACVSCDFEMDFTIFVDKLSVTIPLFGGKSSIGDASIDGTVPVIFVGRHMKDERFNAAPSGISDNGYSLIAGGKGAHRFTARFVLGIEAEGLCESFRLSVPRSPRNSVEFIYDGPRAEIVIEPSIGLKIKPFNGAGKMIATANFGVSETLVVSFRTAPEAHPRQATAAAEELNGKAKIPSAGAAGPDAKGNAREIVPAGKEKDIVPGPAYKCEIDSIYSFGEEEISGLHDVTVKIVKGAVSRITICLPHDVSLDDVPSEICDRAVVKEYSDRLSVEVFLKTPADKDFTFALRTSSRIDRDSVEASIHEIHLPESSGGRGHIAVCSSSGTRVEMKCDPLNLERVDAGELPQNMRNSIVSPLLFSFKCFNGRYAARFVLTRYSDSDSLAALITKSSVNTVVTADGCTVSKISADMKSNGMPYLKLIPDGTAEIVEANVNFAPVRASIDPRSNFRVPIVKSEIKNGTVCDFPVRIKTLAGTEKLTKAAGKFRISLPGVELPVMTFEWRVFVPDGFVFYDLNGSPGLERQAPFPVAYRIPVNIALFARGIFDVEGLPGFAIIAALTAFLVFIVGSVAFGPEKMAAWLSNSWDCLVYIAAAAFNKTIEYVVPGIVMFLILGVLFAVSMPQFAAMTEDAKKTKARQDCDTIAQTAQKYNSLEGTRLNNIMELKGKYLTNIDTLKDPWGNPYQIDAAKGRAVSKGPDGRENTADDVAVYYSDPTLMAPEERGFDGGPKISFEAPDARKISETASRKGIFSVPVNPVKSGTYYTLVKKFVMPGQRVYLDISYMSGEAFALLLGFMFAAGALFPFCLGRFLEFGRLYILALIFCAAIIFAIEYANYYIPQTAYISQLGLLAGALLVSLLKIIRFFGDPDIRRDIADIFSRSFKSVPADGATASSANDGASATGVAVSLFFAVSFASLLVLYASPATASGLLTDEVYYNPSTLEIQAFCARDISSQQPVSDPAKVFVRYSELKYLLDSVRYLESGRVKLFLPPARADVSASPVFKTYIKSISISGEFDTVSADLSLTYHIEARDDDYPSAELFSGNAAPTAFESFAAGPSGELMPCAFANFINQGDSCRAVFETAGQYVVKLRLSIPLTCFEGDYSFYLSPAKCARVDMRLKTPADFDLSAGGLVVTSCTADAASGSVTTSGGLVPAGSYHFKLKLREKVRNEIFTRRRAEEEKKRLALEAAAKSDAAAKKEEAVLLAKKAEPVVNVRSVQVITVEDERFSSNSSFNFEVRNTELRDLQFILPASASVSKVEPAGDIFDWNISRRSAADNRSVLSVSLKTPRGGAFSIKVAYELPFGATVTGAVPGAADDIRKETAAPIAYPASCDSHVAYLAVDSAVNADVAVTRSENLIPIDERDIPFNLARALQSPVLYSFRSNKSSASLLLSVIRNSDIAATPLVIDTASYKTFVTKAGYALTSARYQVRNNNSQFLEVALPKNSRTWSLKVGDRLVKPSRNGEGPVYIPLLKSPLVDNEFAAFIVELVYVTRMAEFENSGSARFEIPKIASLCSRINWEFYFMDGYVVTGQSSNLRQFKSRRNVEFLDTGAARPLSLDEIVALQDKMRANNNSAALPSSMMRFGGEARGFLPISAEFPELSSKALYFSGENLKNATGSENAPSHYIELTYRSRSSFEAFSFAGYVLGAIFSIWSLAAYFRTRRFRPLIAFGAITAVYCLAMFNFDANSMNYLFAGLFMGLILTLLGTIARRDRVRSDAV